MNDNFDLNKYLYNNPLTEVDISMGIGVMEELERLFNNDDLEGLKSFRQRFDYPKATMKVKKLVPQLIKHLEDKKAAGKLNPGKLDEMDINDPILMKMRADKEDRRKEREKQADLDKRFGKSYFDKLDAEIVLKQQLGDLKSEREQIMIDMEQEAEPVGGVVADKYGSRLNDIDSRMKLIQKDIDDLRMYESVNEDLTIGGKKVKKIHKNNSNNPKNYTIEYEDGITEPYLDHLKESVNEGAKKYFGVFRKGGNMGQGNEKLVYSFVDKEEAKQRAKGLRNTLSPGEKSYYGMTYIVKPTDVEPESINENALKDEIEKEMEDNKSKFKTSFPTRDLRQILNTENPKDLPNSAKKVLDKLKKKYKINESVNEDLTIGGKKVKKIHKNNSNNPKNYTIEYEDGSTEPYLDHLKESVNEQLSMISKRRAKASLRQIKSGKRDDGMGKFDAKLYGVDSDGKEHEIKDESDLSKYEKFGLRSESVNEDISPISRFLQYLEK